MAYKSSTVSRNAAANGVTALYNTGYIRIYSGTQPANPQTALSGNTLLADPRFNATAFGAVATGVLTANAITADASADATGTATFARIFQSDGTTVLGDATVGTSGTDIVLNTVSIVVGGNVSISSLTLTQPE